MNRLTGKKILIVGANGGIGHACVRQCLLEGAQIIASGRADHFKDESLMPRINKYIKADMMSTKSIRQLFDDVRTSWESIDSFVYCAGIGSSYGFKETTEEHFSRVMRVNLEAAFLCSQQAEKLLSASQGGNIVLVASQKGLCGSTGSLAYNASKGAMIIMARSMAMELACENIRVNCICPGPTRTDMLLQDAEKQGNQKEIIRKIEQSTLVKRLGEPEEIAHGVVFLASDEAQFVTGTELLADGGNICGVRNF